MHTPRPGLQRSREHRIVAGVCGGLAEWLGWSPTLVRVLFVAVSVLSAAFPGILVYLGLWILMPSRPDRLGSPGHGQVQRT
jgi:phage shock protein PspC (stress-responsive transcriptional regulator)